MKRMYQLLCLLLCVGVGLPLAAQNQDALQVPAEEEPVAAKEKPAQIKTYRVEDVPNVQLLNSTRFVTDPNDHIPAEQEAALNRRIAQLRDSFDVEIAIVVLPAYDTDAYGTAREFANELFKAWGIGKKETNRGLLIQLFTASDEREITFEVGYGLEGELTDAMCKLIQTRRMIPIMKDGDYGAGLLVGLEEVRKMLTHESTLQAEKDRETQRYILFWWLTGVVCYGASLWSQWRRIRHSEKIGIAYRINRGSDISAIVSGLLFFQLPGLLLYFLVKVIYRKHFATPVACPECGTVGRFKRLPDSPSKKKKKKNANQSDHFECRSCGHQFKEHGPFQTGASWWMPIVLFLFETLLDTLFSSGRSDDSRGGRSWGGGSRGGGSRGGSWGGGSSGGGGASTRF